MREPGEPREPREPGEPSQGAREPREPRADGCTGQDRTAQDTLIASELRTRRSENKSNKCKWMGPSRQQPEQQPEQQPGLNQP
jgi:hypothetical protein